MSSATHLYPHARHPMCLKSDTSYTGLTFITNFTLRLLFLHISLDFVSSFRFIFLSFMVSLHYFVLKYPQFLLFF